MNTEKLCMYILNKIIETKIHTYTYVHMPAAVCYTNVHTYVRTYVCTYVCK